jgi:DNA topoisomerase-1
MICERQAEIDAFVPVEYWNLGADLEASELPIVTARLHQTDGKKAKVSNGEQAAEIVDALNAGKFVVKAIEQKESKQRPGAPFITSRLQQEAARKFGFSVKRTMILAQGLYEGKEIGDLGPTGLITYMRTDSTRVAEEAITAVREFISTSYGEESLPKQPNQYRSKKSAQDAHEAIRPTTFSLPPAAVESYLNADELKLYRLIWSRFVASQMLPAIFDVTQADIKNGRHILRAKGKILRKPGFLSVYRETTSADQNSSDVKDDLLPPLEEGEALKLVKVNSEQKFTKPPAQFSEASLVKALEDNGIGRPSTYASILSTLSDRSYAEKISRRFTPTALGKLVNTLLQDGFSDIINEGYTAKLEEVLDQIEEGKLDWRKELGSFDKKFDKDLAVAEIEMPNVKKNGIPTDEICPECKSPLVMRFGRFGGFLGCTAYPKCGFTRNIEEPADQNEAASEEEIAPCEKCGKPMAKKRSRYGVFYGCSGYPDCKNIRRTGPPAEEPQTTGVPCPECGGKGEIVQKRSRRGKIFFSCNRYPDCKFALWNKPIAEPCPQCKSPFLMEKTTKKKGLHKICNDKECDFEESLEAAAEAS